MPLLAFARQSRPGSASTGYSGERLENYFLRPSDGVSPGVLVGRSGTVATADLGGPVRAVVDNGGTLYVCAAFKLWKIVGGVATAIGSIADDRETYMAASGTEVAIVAAGKYYISDGSGLAEYTTGAISRPRAVTFQDGYFIVIGDSSGRSDGVTVSGLSDGTTFAGLDVAFAENAPDELKAAISYYGRLWLFGSKTVEMWYNTGDADFPFEPIRGAILQRGCFDGKSVAVADNAAFWVGDDRAVYRSDGSQLLVVSTREVEEVLRTASIFNGYTFTDRGHVFYAIRTEAETLVYDVTTQLWHQRTTGVLNQPWICTCATFVGGTEFFGTSTGKVVTLDPNAYTDDGDVIRAEAVSAPVESRGRFFSVSRIYLDVDTGRVATDRTPQVMLQTTRDGRNWSVEKWRDLGLEGQYYRKGEWHSLGVFKRFQVRVRITDPVGRDIYGVSYE